MQTQCEYLSLIERTLAGEQAAYGEIYDQTVGDVFRTVHFLIEDKADVDDLVQDIFVETYRSLKKFDTERPFKPWLMGIAMVQIKSYHRKRWMSLRITRKAEENPPIFALDFSDAIVEKITNQELVKLVEKLPFKLKQVIILRYLNDYSQEEIARILGIPLGTVKSRINSALKKLRENGKAAIFLNRGRGLYEY
ncbi:sigma-70 family RNA polymerase sigma factor [Bacillus sp. FJAT-27251]|uniref:sigma-70 family RNA polymerase sigma factor n=1 Tax=Bacillus sp. FJAT-27251 TaxID=1684142 RepID=UPI0006A7A081|nr:sigma-70 family RNA polymerase sigma factor [Bacillus sp. FJAT-27251]